MESLIGRRVATKCGDRVEGEIVGITKNKDNIEVFHVVWDDGIAGYYWLSEIVLL